MMKKRLLSLLLVVCMVLSCVSYSAKAEAGDKDAVIAAMRSIHAVKDEYGMENVDFTTLKIGEAINVYDYVNDTFVFSRIAYPLFSGNELVAILYHVGDSVYQVMNGMDELIMQTNCSEIAIVYDCDGCHVFDGEEFHQIYVAENAGNGKDSLEMDMDELPANEILVSDLSVSYDLGYTNSVTPRDGTSYILSVPYVSQNPYANLCWAASIAAMRNYKHNLSLTAGNVAMDYFEYAGESFGDRMIDIEDVAEHLQRYFPSYTYHNWVPTDAAIERNIVAENPILGSFEGVGCWHDVVIRGFTFETLYIIDPQIGYVAAAKINGWYQYVSTMTNVTLVFDRAICNSW